MNELYFIHRQHHSHKLNENALVKLSALSGTCSHVLEIIIDGHLPVFLPCLVVSIPCSWLICFTLVTNFWVSLIHCTGTRVDMVPSLGGLLMTPNVHSKHHRRGRLNNHNFGIFHNHNFGRTCSLARVRHLPRGKGLELDSMNSKFAVQVCSSILRWLKS